METTILSWRFKTIIQDIKRFSSYFEDISFKQVLCLVNFTADALANLGHNLREVQTWHNGLLLNCLLLNALTTFNFDRFSLGAQGAFNCNFFMSFPFFYIKKKYF